MYIISPQLSLNIRPMLKPEIIFPLCEDVCTNVMASHNYEPLGYEGLGIDQWSLEMFPNSCFNAVVLIPILKPMLLRPNFMQGFS